MRRVPVPRHRSRTPVLAAALVLGGLALAACDATPGARPVEAAPVPVVRDLVVTPGVVQFEDVSEDGTTATFALDAAASVVGAASEVRFLVQPQAGFGAVAELVADAPGDGVARATLDVELPRDRAGLLSVIAVATAPDGRTANEARTTVLVERTNAPPVIDDVSGPDTFSPPGTLRFTVTASDPDGENDLLRVEVVTPAGDRLPLERQPNGRYTAAFSVPEGVEPGPQTFTFFATDRAGAESERVAFTVTLTE